MGDNVNHPEHYQNIAGVEAIDILNDVVKDLPGKQASMLWNTLKYLFRFQKKNGVEDLKKAQNYLQWLIDITENGSIKKHPKDMSQKQTETLQDNKDDDLETSENDSHIVYKSTAYGSADIYYSKELLAGTCTRILFDDKDGRQTFMIKFFRHLRHCKNGFSIQDVMLDNTYRFHKDDTEFCTHVPWNEIFAGFRMYEEGGQYVLEFVYENDNSEPLLEDEWYAYF